MNFLRQRFSADCVKNGTGKSGGPNPHLDAVGNGFVQNRHGLSYSKYHCDYSGIDAEQTLFVAMDDPVEIWRLTLRNDTDRVRNLSVFSYLEFSFHQIAMDNQNFQMSLYAAGSRYEDGVIEHDLYYEKTGYQFFTSNFTPDGFDCLRDVFLGPYRTERNPIAAENGKCSGGYEKGGNHCGSLQKNLTLQTVAGCCYVSQWHLSKLLNRYAEKSFYDILNAIRIQKAKELLSDPKLKIGEIGEMVGYADTAHFARTFKKLEGMSANEYRNGLKR